MSLTSGSNWTTMITLSFVCPVDVLNEQNNDNWHRDAMKMIMLKCFAFNNSNYFPSQNWTLPKMSWNRYEVWFLSKNIKYIKTLCTAYAHYYLNPGHHHLFFKWILIIKCYFNQSSFVSGHIFKWHSFFKLTVFNTFLIDYRRMLRMVS